MWNKVEENLPEREGKYLAYYSRYDGVVTYYQIVNFAKNIYSIIPRTFGGMNKVGFYCINDIDGGYYETFPTYWTELPEPPQE